MIGIINTPRPAPGSIEGIIYTKLPLELHLKGLPEILIQTLLFSYLLAKPIKEKAKNMNFFINNKNSFIAAIACLILFPLFGIISSLIIGVKVTASQDDEGSFIVMFIAVICTFLIAKYYPTIKGKLKDLILAVSLYFLLAVVPYLYNLITNSPFNTPLTFLISIIPTAILFLIIKLSYKKKKLFNS